MAYLGRPGATAPLTSADIPDDSITASKIASGAITAADVAADMATQTELDALTYQGEPHIIPGVLYPAVAGKLLDGSTSHSGAYGTAQADGYSYYYTDIKGSKPIKDPRIGGHFGSQRYVTRSLQLLEEESSIHGENVYSSDGRNFIRFVDNGSTAKWRYEFGGNGNHVRSDGSTNTGLWVEITGYFNDMNFGLACGGDRSSDIDLFVNGVSSQETNTVLGGQAVENVLGSRFVSSASLIHGGSTLSTSLGTTPAINTVKHLVATGSGDYIWFGMFELIAQDTTSTANKSKIQIPSQNVVSYGKKFTVSGTPHYDPFNGMSGAKTLAELGTYIDTATSLGMENWKGGTSNYYKPFNGGRVVKWVDSSGTIKTSVTMMPPNAQNISATASNAVSDAHIQAGTNDDVINFNTSAIDHSQAEVAKNFHWREFGNGGANFNATYPDASTLAESFIDIYYVMDDGLTSMGGDNIKHSSGHPNLQDAGASMYITFIGTGLSATNSTLVQNLPYGTHIIKFGAGSSVNPITCDGIVVHTDLNIMNSSGGAGDYLNLHQPKKPPIPEEAVVLCDFMLMADFVPRTANGLQYISKGVRYCSASRDILCDGQTFNMYLNSADVPGGGFQVQANSPDADTSFTIPSFSTNVVTIGYDSSGSSGVARRQTWKTNGSTIADGDLTYNATETDGHATYYYPTASTTLGNNVYQQVGTNSSGHPVTCEGNEFVSPIHTSYHYRDIRGNTGFETPYLHELIGGDRNMEQHNLIVTPDGKTWDEVTRDTSHIGNIVGVANHDTAKDWPNIWMMNKWRGGDDGRTSQHYVQKDFAIAHDRIIFLKSGYYKFNVLWTANGGGEHWTLLKNTVACGLAYAIDDGGATSDSWTLEVKRGDEIQCKGTWGSDMSYHGFFIERV